MNDGGRERAASGPRQGRKNQRSSSDWASLAKIFHIEHFRAMQILRSPTGLGRHKFDTKQIFPDTAPQPKPQAHIKEQTDGRIPQTIVRIQSYDRKRLIFPGSSVRHRSAFDTPGLEQTCLDGKQIRLYNPFGGPEASWKPNTTQNHVIAPRVPEDSV